MSLAPSPEHYLVVPVSGWGHLRPLLHLSLNLLHLRPALRLTLLVDAVSATRSRKMLSTDPGWQAVAGQLTMVVLPEGAEPVLADLQGSGRDVMLLALRELFKSPSPPTLALFDWFHVDFVACVKETLGRLSLPRIPVYCFIAHIAAALCQCVQSRTSQRTRLTCGSFAPIEQGGYLAVAQAEVDRLMAAGVEKYEAYQRAFHMRRDSLVALPGLSPVKAWERIPQLGSITFPGESCELFKMSRDACLDPWCTGLVMPTIEEIEGDAIQAIRLEHGKEFWSVGPQFADYVWNLTPPTDDLGSAPDAALTFLDEQLRLRGPRSVVYISFGSLFWPVRRPELLNILIASLPPHMAFLLSNASAMSQLTPEQMALWGMGSGSPGAAAEDGAGAEGQRGRVVSFAPQWRVLRHPAVAWFVTHCGQSSMQESILAEMPTVGIPHFADQNESMMILAQLGTGIELQHFRSGVDGLKRTNGTVIDSSLENVTREMKETWATMERDGEYMRARAKQARALLVHSHTKGMSYQAMLNFGRPASA